MNTTSEQAVFDEIAANQQHFSKASQVFFLAAMVSFYNADDGGALLKRVGVNGLADLGGLDLERRRIIATLMLNDTGW